MLAAQSARSLSVDYSPHLAPGFVRWWSIRLGQSSALHNSVLLLYRPIICRHMTAFRSELVNTYAAGTDAQRFSRIAE